MRPKGIGESEHLPLHFWLNRAPFRMAVTMPGVDGRGFLSMTLTYYLMWMLVRGAYRRLAGTTPVSLSDR